MQCKTTKSMFAKNIPRPYRIIPIPKIYWQGRLYTWFTNTELRDNDKEPCVTVPIRKIFPNAILGPAYDPENLGLDRFILGAYLDKDGMKEWYNWKHDIRR